MVKWTQRKMLEWQIATFGAPVTPERLNWRMGLEVEELTEAIGTVARLEVSSWAKNEKDAVRSELADVAILLMQTAEACGIDLDSAIDDKMEVNQGRRWVRDPATGSVSHVKTFRHWTDGTELDIGRWHLLRDNGTAVASFLTREDAELVCDRWQSGNVRTPTWDPAQKSWLDYFPYYNILFGRDIYDFQTDQGLAFIAPGEKEAT